MPFYDVRCARHGVTEVRSSMRDAEFRMPCAVCGDLSPQIFHAPQFTQDNLRLYTDGRGGRFSHALGMDMPDSRQARDRAAKAKGVEFVGKSEFLSDNKEAAAAVAYKEHVDTGGKRDEWKPSGANPWKAAGLF